MVYKTSINAEYFGVYVAVLLEVGSSAKVDKSRYLRDVQENPDKYRYFFGKFSFAIDQIASLQEKYKESEGIPLREFLNLKLNASNVSIASSPMQKNKTKFNIVSNPSDKEGIKSAYNVQTLTLSATQNNKVVISTKIHSSDPDKLDGIISKFLDETEPVDKLSYELASSGFIKIEDGDLTKYASVDLFSIDLSFVESEFNSAFNMIHIIHNKSGEKIPLILTQITEDGKVKFEIIIRNSYTFCSNLERDILGYDFSEFTKAAIEDAVSIPSTEISGSISDLPKQINIYLGSSRLTN